MAQAARRTRQNRFSYNIIVQNTLTGQAASGSRGKGVRVNDRDYVKDGFRTRLHHTCHSVRAMRKCAQVKQT